MAKLEGIDASRDKGKRIHPIDTRKAPENVQPENLQRDQEGDEPSQSIDSSQPSRHVIVRSILRGPSASLVQWENEGRLKRGWIPNGSIDDDWRVSSFELQRSMPYGLPLHKIINSIIIDNLDLEDAMHRKNIWTEQDVIKNPMEIARAIAAAAQLSTAKIQTWVREYVQRQDEEVSHA